MDFQEERPTVPLPSGEAEKEKIKKRKDKHDLESDVSTLRSTLPDHPSPSLVQDHKTCNNRSHKLITRTVVKC